MDSAALARDLADYYNAEAALRAARPIDPVRVDRRRAFIDRLVREGRRRVVEIGTGPGIDARGFLDAGLGVSGVDLSFEHARLACVGGVEACRASVLALPFADASFDAAWTMSTLLHVPNELLSAALGEIARVLTDDAPVAVGLWGSGADSDIESTMDADTIEPRRFFSRRSDAHLESVLGELGDVESFETWDRGEGTWTYQFAVVRRRPRR